MTVMTLCIAWELNSYQVVCIFRLNGIENS